MLDYPDDYHVGKDLVTIIVTRKVLRHIFCEKDSMHIDFYKGSAFRDIRIILNTMSEVYFYGGSVASTGVFLLLRTSVSYSAPRDLYRRVSY